VVLFRSGVGSWPSEPGTAALRNHPPGRLIVLAPGSLPAPGLPPDPSTLSAAVPGSSFSLASRCQHPDPARTLRRRSDLSRGSALREMAG